MKFKEVSKISGLLAKEYAEDFFKLLVIYQTISASEAASRLGLHIKTAQDFLEGLTEWGMLKKEEVYEKKRPYFRYTLVKHQINIETDLSALRDSTRGEKRLKWKIREQKNAGVVFTPAGSGRKIASVTLFTGRGRKRKEWKISLTEAQGKFLFHLPFPTEPARPLESILEKADVGDSCVEEILDIVELLAENRVIDIHFGEGNPVGRGPAAKRGEYK